MIIKQFQLGGGISLPTLPSYTPIINTNSRASSVSEKESSGENDLTDKDLLKMLEKLDGLPNDMAALTQTLLNFYIDLEYGILPSTGNIATRYLSALNQMKVANFNKKEYDNAYDQVKANGGINEIAIDEHGQVICVDSEGNYPRMSVTDYINADKSKVQALTNAELLLLRAQSPDFINKNGIISVVQNGIGMKTINELINNAVRNLGSDELRNEGYTKTEQEQIKQGLEYLYKAQEMAMDQGIEENTSVDGLYNIGVLTRDLARQAQNALYYIYKTLPKNAKALLEIKAYEQGVEGGAVSLINSLITSRTSRKNNLDLSRSNIPGSSSKSKSKSEGGDQDILDKINLNPVLMMQAGMSDRQQVTLNPGSGKYSMTVDALIVPITKKSGELLGANANMEEVSRSAFGHVLDMNNVTMGGQEIDPNALSQVVVDSTNLYVMNLPIDQNAPNGVIKPNLTFLRTIEALNSKIRAEKITDPKEINKLYVEAGLPVLLDDEGNLNIYNYRKFGVLNGRTAGRSFGNLDDLNIMAREIDDENAIKNYLDAVNHGRSNDNKITWETGWFDPFGTNDTLYEGSVYIPIRTNSLAGAMSSGITLSPQQAAVLEGREQQKERLAALGGYHSGGMEL